MVLTRRQGKKKPEAKQTGSDLPGEEEEKNLLRANSQTEQEGNQRGAAEEVKHGLDLTRFLVADGNEEGDTGTHQDREAPGLLSRVRSRGWQAEISVKGVKWFRPRQHRGKFAVWQRNIPVLRCRRLSRSLTAALNLLASSSLAKFRPI